MELTATKCASPLVCFRRKSVFISIEGEAFYFFFCEWDCSYWVSVPRPAVLKQSQACAELPRRVVRETDFADGHNLTIKGYFSWQQYKRKYLLIVWLSLSEAQRANFQHRRLWAALSTKKRGTCSTSRPPHSVSMFAHLFLPVTY